MYYIVAGTEFRELEGHILLIIIFLYGLWTSAKRWHDWLPETLRRMGFIPSKTNLNVRFKDCDTHYEYCHIYGNDVIFIRKNPI